MGHTKGLQSDLFNCGHTVYTRTRPTDPWTSRAAAAEAVKRLSKLRREVYELFVTEAKTIKRGLTQFEVEQHFSNHGSTYRSRVSELADPNYTDPPLLKDSGHTRCIKGKHRVIWILTDPDAYKGSYD